MLNVILNQILTGRYSFNETNLFTQSGTLTNKLDKYLGGIHLKDILNEIQSKLKLDLHISER